MGARRQLFHGLRCLHSKHFSRLSALLPSGVLESLSLESEPLSRSGQCTSTKGRIWDHFPRPHSTGAAKWPHVRPSPVESVHSLASFSTYASSERRISPLPKGPGLKDFIFGSASVSSNELEVDCLESLLPPYLSRTTDGSIENGKVFFETYGCQMNVSDMELVLGILNKVGYTERVDAPENADVILVMTCAIRENAERKIWHRLGYFKNLKLEWRDRKGRTSSPHPPKVAVLGCMAERLKTSLLDARKLVDVVCGPDAYRDLPRLLAEVESGQPGINVLLSLEETYADVSPVRVAQNSASAFVSIMRGCDNMCSYCIVPFTRGRERSRPVGSIVKEVGELWEQGVKEVTLLGQNVNSYRDLSEPALSVAASASAASLSPGFTTIYKQKEGGLRFAHLLDHLSALYPEMRFRFTSPHPKDFPADLIALLKDRRNVCKSIHLPAQSGSSRVLAAMRRGHTREAYLALVDQIREAVPDIAISSDFISGFCGESEEDHQDTLSLLELVQYDMAYMFAYSMREKTYAHRRLLDDVPADVKLRRLAEVIETFRATAPKRYEAQVGQTQVVFVEGPNKRNPDKEVHGRNDYNHKVVLPKYLEVGPLLTGSRRDEHELEAGDYVQVEITSSSTASLRGTPLQRTSLAGISCLPEASKPVSVAV